MGRVSLEANGSPSYVVGSAYSLLELSPDEKLLLDRSPWVFCCNSFLSHWRVAGFRPTVWAWGDTDRRHLIDEFGRELEAINRDFDLSRRPRLRFVSLENERRLVELAIRNSGLDVTVYHRGPPWEINQPIGKLPSDQIYHYASTITDLVNLAWILNPGHPIKIVGNPYGERFGHFYDADRRFPIDRDMNFWRGVKRGMWEGLSYLRQAGLPLLDCNRRHEWELPPDLALPRGELIE